MLEKKRVVSVRMSIFYRPDAVSNKCRQSLRRSHGCMYIRMYVSRLLLLITESSRIKGFEH